MSGYNREIDTGFDIAESMKFLADLNVYEKMKMEWGVSQKMAAQALLALTNTETSSVTRRPARQSCVRHSGYAVDSTHQAADVVVNLKLMMLDQCMNCMSEGELSRTRQEGLFHLAILGRMGSWYTPCGTAQTGIDLDVSRSMPIIRLPRDLQLSL